MSILPRKVACRIRLFPPGSFGRLWETLGDSGGAFGEALGGFGEHWETLGEPLGSLWEALGMLWKALGRRWEAVRILWGSFGEALWRIWGGFGRLWEALGMHATRRRTKKTTIYKNAGSTQTTDKPALLAHVIVIY